jgi:hypothetical protein
MRRLAWLALMLAVGACRSGGGGGAQGGAPDGSVIVVQGTELSGTLLEGLRIRVPAMLVTERPGQCPQIIFRGQRSMATQGNPSVYLDGTLMSDTCLLSQMPASDIRSVEVYPSGNTSRPGIQRNPFGIIMVFRHRV